MITRTDLNERINEWGIREDVIEKDYVIGWVLWGIGSDPSLSTSWVFKGGTCLRKCYVETYRFSEDLDFTVLPGGPAEASQVIPHFKYASDSARPWRGNGPIDVATLAGRLSAETVNQLADESSGPVGRLLGIPADGDDGTVQALKEDISKAKGRVALLEAGDWDAAGSATVSLEPKRFGAEPPQSLVNLHELATREIIAACGFNPSLFQVGPAAAIREAWRLALFGVLSPLGRKVERELQDKLEDTVTLSWQELRASDLSGRARAFQSMVGGGMDVVKAVAIAGLMTPEE